METGERRKENGERRKENGDRRKEKGERRKETGEWKKVTTILLISFSDLLRFPVSLFPSPFSMPSILSDMDIGGMNMNGLGIEMFPFPSIFFHGKGNDVLFTDGEIKTTANIGRGIEFQFAPQ